MEQTELLPLNLQLFADNPNGGLGTPDPNPQGEPNPGENPPGNGEPGSDDKDELTDNDKKNILDFLFLICYVFKITLK